MYWTTTAVRGIIAAIVALCGFAILWAAKRQGKTEQSLQDQLAGEKAKAEIVEKSNEVSEAAAARSDPRVHDDPSLVRGDTLPGWLKR